MLGFGELDRAGLRKAWHARLSHYLEKIPSPRASVLGDKGGACPPLPAAPLKGRGLRSLPPHQLAEENKKIAHSFPDAMFFLTCSKRALCCLPACLLVLFLGPQQSLPTSGRQPRPPRGRGKGRCSGQLQILDTRLQRQWPVLLCRAGRRHTERHGLSFFNCVLATQIIL